MVSLVKVKTDIEHFTSFSDFRVADKKRLMLYIPGKRYNVADVSAALCMSLGLIWFTLADSKVAPNFNVTGKAFVIPQQTAEVQQKS